MSDVFDGIHIQLWVTMSIVKTIQITIDEKLLAVLDRTLRGKTRRRSAFIRQSITSELKRLTRSRLEQMDRAGYELNPVEQAEFEVHGPRLAWGGEWKETKQRKNRRRGR